MTTRTAWYVEKIWTANTLKMYAVSDPVKIGLAQQLNEAMSSWLVQQMWSHEYQKLDAVDGNWLIADDGKFARITNNSQATPVAAV